MSATGWMSLADAYKHVVRLEKSGARAERLLLDALRNGHIKARAESAKVYETDGRTTIRRGREVETRIWFADNIQLEGGWVTQRKSSPRLTLALPNGEIGSVPQEPQPIIAVYEIDLLIADLHRLWPEPGTFSAALPSRPAAIRGGRPATHDWAGASGYMTSWLVENDYPATQSAAVKALTQWFEREGKAPDERELRRWISKLYQGR